MSCDELQDFEHIGQLIGAIPSQESMVAEIIHVYMFISQF